MRNDGTYRVKAWRERKGRPKGTLEFKGAARKEVSHLSNRILALSIGRLNWQKMTETTIELTFVRKAALVARVPYGLAPKSGLFACLRLFLNEIRSLLIAMWNYQNMADLIKLTLGDGSEIVGGTLEEAEEKLAALKKQQREAIESLLQAADSARARKLPKFDPAGNRIG